MQVIWFAFLIYSTRTHERYTLKWNEYVYKHFQSDNISATAFINAQNFFVQEIIYTKRIFPAGNNMKLGQKHLRYNLTEIEKYRSLTTNKF